MKARRAKVRDEGETLIFNTDQVTGDRLYGGPGQATRLFTPRMYATTYGLVVYSTEDPEDTRTLYPWDKVEWVEESNRR